MVGLADGPSRLSLPMSDVPNSISAEVLMLERAYPDALSPAAVSRMTRRPLSQVIHAVLTGTPLPVGRYYTPFAARYNELGLHEDSFVEITCGCPQGSTNASPSALACWTPWSGKNQDDCQMPCLVAWNSQCHHKPSNELCYLPHISQVASWHPNYSFAISGQALV